MNEHEIKKLTDYQHSRLKTEMYLGSRSLHTQLILNINNEGHPEPVEITWVPAVYTAFREILDNALDEVIGFNKGFRIDVKYNPATMEFSVEDNGRGIPIEYDEKEQMHKATLALTHARAGRNFEERGNVAGTNGIGASIVNFCSEYFRMTINRDGTKFYQKFSEGKDALKIEEPSIRTITSERTGTKIEWKLSSKVFEDTTLPEKFIRSRVHEIALINPKIKIYYNGEYFRTSKAYDKTLFAEYEPIKIEIKKEKFHSTFWIVPEFSENEMVHTIVNNVLAFNGGVHIETFRTEFYRGMVEGLAREGKRRKVIPNRSDINDGVLIYNVTVMHAPDFDSQSKTRLINEWVGKEIKEFFKDDKVIKNIIKKNKNWIELIFERALARTNKKDLLDFKKKSRANKKVKTEGFRDATGTDRSKCILFLAEGRSAISGMSSVRNPEIHGGLPLRGKVLNVNGETLKKVIDNQVIIDITNSMGLIIGERANRYKLRYGQIYIATDMDPDGANICALLINFFYTYWPELFDPEQATFISVFMTPFIIVNKGKERKYWYGHNYDEFKPEDWTGWEITRAKGLGTLQKADWKHSLEQPDLYPIVDDGNMKEALDLIFNGKRADDRKEWIGM